MNEKMLVSIIVMTYKKFECLENNLQSIKNQDYPNIEVLIFDDGSDNFDNSFIEKILNKICMNNVIIHHSLQNKGTVKNYNEAIKASKGDIIVPLSADDYFYDSHFITKLVNYFKENNCIVCYSKRKGNITGKEYPSPKDEELLKSNKDIFNRLAFEGLYSGSTLYYKKEVFEKIGYFDEKFKLLEDYPYSVKLYLNDIKISYFDEIAIYYGECGISNSKISDVLKSDVLNNILYILDNKNFVKNKRCLKYIKLKKDRLEGCNKIKLYFKYFSVYVYLFMFKLNKKIRKTHDSFYWFYVGE